MIPRPDPSETETETKTAPRRRRERPWLRRLLVFVACVVALDALVGERSALQTLRADRERKRIAAEVYDLRRQNQELHQHIERLRSDPRAIEQAARGQLGLIRRGEILVVLADAPRR